MYDESFVKSIRSISTEIRNSKGPVSDSLKLDLIQAIESCVFPPDLHFEPGRLRKWGAINPHMFRVQISHKPVVVGTYDFGYAVGCTMVCPLTEYALTSFIDQSNKDFVIGDDDVLSTEQCRQPISNIYIDLVVNLSALVQENTRGLSVRTMRALGRHFAHFLPGLYRYGDNQLETSQRLYQLPRMVCYTPEHATDIWGRVSKAMVNILGFERCGARSGMQKNCLDFGDLNKSDVCMEHKRKLLRAAMNLQYFQCLRRSSHKA